MKLNRYRINFVGSQQSEVVKSTYYLSSRNGLVHFYNELDENFVSYSVYNITSIELLKDS